MQPRPARRGRYCQMGRRLVGRGAACAQEA